MVAIHLAVRDIVGQVGRAVLRDPDQFRAVLDDVLDEDAAGVGEVNLLVDAVRFDTAGQLVGLLDSDADVRRAVETAGTAFARLRGGADPRAATWAAAVLGFAIDRVPEQVVLELAPRRPGPPPPASATPASAAPEATGYPAPGSSPPSLPPTRVASTPPLPPSTPPVPGATRAFSEVLPPAPPVAPPPVAPPYYATAPALPPASRRRSTGAIVAVVGVVLAVIAAGFVAWHFFWPRGGAGSPEEAVEELMLAVANQDLVAVIDLVSPAEVDGLDEVYGSALELAEDEDLIEDEGITDAVDLELSDLEFDVAELGDDLARVTLVDGRYDLRWDPDRLPERLDFVADESDAESESGDLSDALDGDTPAVTTVRIDGRWYVTLLGTFADLFYREFERGADEEGWDLDRPDYDLASEAPDAITGDDPEAVIANLVSAGDSGDVERLFANLPEDLVKPLRPYEPVIEDVMRPGTWFDGALGFDVAADGLDLETEELDDGLLKVTVNTATFSGAVLEDEVVRDSGSVVVEGSCVDAFDDGALAESGCLGEEEIVADLGLDEIFFVLREVDDGYQLDPAATWVQYAETAVDNLTSDLVDEILRDIEDGL